MNAILNYDALLISAVYSIDINKLKVNVIEENSHVICLRSGGGGGGVYVKEVTLCKRGAHHALKVSHLKISHVLEIERLLLPGSFRNVPVDSVCCQHP